MRTIIFGALMALTIMPVHAALDTVSVNYMLSYCKMTVKELAVNTTNAMGYGRCYGTVYGVSQILILLEHTQHPDPLVCTTVPPAATSEQLVNVVIKYAEAHPEVTLAFAANCPRSNAKVARANGNACSVKTGGIADGPRTS
jgi:hypothetical protein